MMLPELDEATHRYSIDGRTVISVTQVMQQGGIIDPSWYTEEARDRGTAVHAAIHYLNEGTLDYATIDPLIIPFLKAYVRFTRIGGFKPLLYEKICYSDAHDYATRIDIYGQWPTGTHSLIEIKTGRRPKWVPIQLAAQRQAALESGLCPSSLYSLTLDGSGDFRLNQETQSDALPLFLAALGRTRGVAA